MHPDPARSARTTGGQLQLDVETIPDQQTGMAEQELLVAERHAALREAFTRLPSRCQQLIALLIEDPPVPYAQISAKLGIPVGSIGPSRRRCLEKLRRDPAIATLISTEATSAGSGLSRQATAAAMRISKLPRSQLGHRS